MVTFLTSPPSPMMLNKPAFCSDLSTFNLIVAPFPSNTPVYPASLTFAGIGCHVSSETSMLATPSATFAQMPRFAAFPSNNAANDFKSAASSIIYGSLYVPLPDNVPSAACTSSVPRLLPKTLVTINANARKRLNTEDILFFSVNRLFFIFSLLHIFNT